MVLLTPAKDAAPGRRGSRIYFAGAIVGQACGLLRYTLLARLIGPEQLGLVAILILASNFFENISDTGGDRFLVQDPDGDKPEVQKFVQLVFIGRGLTLALGMLIFALPISRFYGEPALFIGLAVLGLSPLIGGLMHLDTRRFQRVNDFRAEGLGMVISEIVSLLATLVAAWLTRDYTAYLWGMIGRALALVAISHITAQRPYRLGFNRPIARRLAAFSAPLIANGMLLFAAGQSDRLMVSKLVGLEALGHYSAVLLLILYPTGALGRFVLGIHLPLTARAPPVPTRGSQQDLLAGRVLLLSLAICAGFALMAPFAVRLLFGEKFAQAPLLIALVGVLQTGRFIRNWPTTVALGLGKSYIVMANNFARMLGIPAAFAGLALLGGVTGVVSGFIVGEFAALITAIILLNRERGVGRTYDFDRIAAFTGGCALIVGLAAAAQYRWLPGLALLPAAALLLLWLVRHERPAIEGGLRIAMRMARRKG